MDARLQVNLSVDSFLEPQMQLYSSEKQPPHSSEIVCRQSQLIALLTGVAYVGLLGILPATLWYTEDLPVGLAAWIGLLGVLLLPMVVGRFLALLRSSNWTLAVCPDGVWVNLRSYQNYQLDPGKTVVFFPYREITFASEHAENRSAETGDSIVKWKEISMNLQLDVSNIATLRHEIADERVRCTTRSFFGGLITVSGRTNHVPAMLLSDGTLRINWKSRYDFLRPSLSHVMDALSRYVSVAEPVPAVESSDGWDVLTDYQLHDEILRSVLSGDSMSAVRILTAQRGYSVTEAKKFIDQLEDAEHVNAT